MATQTTGTLKETTLNAGEWLFRLQKDDTGGWPEFKGKPTSILNTAEAILGILDANAAERGDARIRLGANLIANAQVQSGPDKGAWLREDPDEKESIGAVPDLVRTSFATQALFKTGEQKEHDAANRGIQWLLPLQCSDYGWPYHRNGSSEVISTCFALDAMLEAHLAGTRGIDDSIKKGLGFLLSRQEADGSFGSGHLVGVSTVFVTRVLQRARGYGLPVHLEEEKKAIKWMLLNGDEVIRSEEVRIPIDPVGKADYNFLFINDTMLINVLMNSNSKDHGTSKLALKALNRLKSRIARDGGISGPRVFSWSTAKAMSALTAAQKVYKELPTTPPELPGVRGSYVFLSFAFVLVGIVTYLSSTNSLGVYATSVFIILLLAVLLVLGFIGEKTFKEILQGFGSPWKK